MPGHRACRASCWRTTTRTTWRSSNSTWRGPPYQLETACNGRGSRGTPRRRAPGPHFHGPRNAGPGRLRGHPGHPAPGADPGRPAHPHPGPDRPRHGRTPGTLPPGRIHGLPGQARAQDGHPGRPGPPPGRAGRVGPRATRRPPAPAGPSAQRIRPLLPLFFATCEETLQGANRALALGDLEAARFFGHKLKGSARTFGFWDLGQAGEILERAAEDGDARGAVAALRQAMELRDRARRETAA